MARVKCSECNGTGKVICRWCAGSGIDLHDRFACGCDDGYVSCEKCTGKGYTGIDPVEDMYEKGLAYIEGDGVPEDHKQAALWLLKAAEQGHAGAQFHIGLCYYHVIGVAQDDEKAIYWLKKAAAQGHEEAKKELNEIGS